MEDEFVKQVRLKLLAVFKKHVAIDRDILYQHLLDRTDIDIFLSGELDRFICEFKMKCLTNIHTDICTEKRTKILNKIFIPEDLWQHFKASFFPQWLLKWFPVRYKELYQTIVSETYHNIYNVFPMVQVPKDIAMCVDNSSTVVSKIELRNKILNTYTAKNCEKCGNRHY